MMSVDDYGDYTRLLIGKIIRDNNGSAWIGKFNTEPLQPVLTRIGEDYNVKNYEADFILKEYDETLVRLLAIRRIQPYDGTKQDSKILGAIYDRMLEIGGMHLYWR